MYNNTYWQKVMTEKISITEFNKRFKPNGKRFVEKSGKVKHGNRKYRYRSIQGFERDYDSIGEARCAAALDVMIERKVILSWAPQVSFLLPGNTRHYVDFIVFYADGRYLLLEFKGHDTAAGKRNRKQVEGMYRVKIEVVFSIKEAENAILRGVK